MKFRKKPTKVDAEQYTEHGKLVKGMCNSQSCYAKGNTEPHVHTIHNDQIVLVEVGDWIIREYDGIHSYPCKPDIFAETYEPFVDDKIKNEYFNGEDIPLVACFEPPVEFMVNAEGLYCPGCGKPQVLCLNDTTGCVNHG